MRKLSLTWCKSCRKLCWITPEFDGVCQECRDASAVFFIAATDDCFELPVFVGDTQTQLARYLRLSDGAVCHMLQAAKDGVVHCKSPNRGIKYFRISRRSGAVVRGKLREAL